MWCLCSMALVGILLAPDQQLRSPSGRQSLENTQPVTAPGGDGSAAQAKTAPVPELTGGRITRRAPAAQLMPSRGWTRTSSESKLHPRALAQRTLASELGSGRPSAPPHSLLSCPLGELLRPRDSGEPVVAVAVDWRWLDETRRSGDEGQKYLYI
jgi:hypothetical protein